MFRARRRPGPLARALNLLWPRSGFRRASRYLVARLGRMPASPHRVAAGVASGAAVSFLPLPGFHFVLGFVLAWLTRGNMLAAAIGTAVGNPWTFPFMWFGGFLLGRYLFGFGVEADTVTAGALMGAIGDVWSWLTGALTFEEMRRSTGGLFLPTLCGGALFGAAAWPLIYGLTYRTVAMAQHARRARLAASRRAPEGQSAG